MGVGVGGGDEIKPSDQTSGQHRLVGDESGNPGSGRCCLRPCTTRTVIGTVYEPAVGIKGA